MKTLSTLFAMCFAAAAAAQSPSDQPAPPTAQHGPHGPHGPPGMDIDRLTVLLDLDPYQKQQVAQVLNDQRNAMRAERQANEASGTRPNFADVQAHRLDAQQQMITKLKVLMEPPTGGRGYRGTPPAPAATN